MCHVVAVERRFLATYCLYIGYLMFIYKKDDFQLIKILTLGIEHRCEGVWYEDCDDEGICLECGKKAPSDMVFAYRLLNT